MAVHSKCWLLILAERIYNLIRAMGFLAMFTFQLDIAVMGVVDMFGPYIFITLDATYNEGKILFCQIDNILGLPISD